MQRSINITEGHHKETTFAHHKLSYRILQPSEIRDPDKFFCTSRMQRTDPPNLQITSRVFITNPETGASR